jgi:hypothetical protein
MGLVGTAALGYVALVMVSVLQTAAGLTPLDVGAVAALLYLLGVGMLGVAFLAAILALRNPTFRSLELTGNRPLRHAACALWQGGAR